MTSERVHFRMLRMPCCNHQLCWVNPRLPSYCPECGTRVFSLIKLDPSLILVSAPDSTLKYRSV